jgi:hypothetical protein
MIGFNRADSEVHMCEPPGGGVGLLTENGDVGGVAAVSLDEAFGLHEHASRTAAGVVDTPVVWLEHLDQESDNTTWRVELSA